MFRAGDICLLLSGAMAGEECEILWGPGTFNTNLGEFYGYRVAIPAAVKLGRPPRGASGNGFFADFESVGPLPAANTKTAFDAALWVPEGLERKP